MIGMLLLADYRLCSFSLVKGILLLKTFRVCRCNALTSVCSRYISVIFEVGEMGCTDDTRTSG